jgi:hypothetical protein
VQLTYLANVLLFGAVIQQSSFNLSLLFAIIIQFGAVIQQSSFNLSLLFAIIIQFGAVFQQSSFNLSLLFSNHHPVSRYHLLITFQFGGTSVKANDGIVK